MSAKFRMENFCVKTVHATENLMSDTSLQMWYIAKYCKEAVRVLLIKCLLHSLNAILQYLCCIFALKYMFVETS